MVDMASAPASMSLPPSGKAQTREPVNLSRAVAAVFAGAAIVVALAGCGHGKSISILVAGRHEQVQAGTNLGQVAARFRIHPRSGDLLDVQGNVLRRAAFASSLLLNGHPAPSATRLGNGDRVAAATGHDRTERHQQEVLPIRGGSPTNPQFTLARTPGVQVIVRGVISHELVSSQFRPSGRRPVVERAVALTFDDGPSPAYTLRVLAVLRRLHVRATFFVIGYLAERYPHLVALEKRDGMAIGNHTYNHPEVPPLGQLPVQLVRDEIALGARSLTRLGITPRLLRPPAGSFSPAVLHAAAALGERVVLWSVDPTDWSAGINAQQIATRVLNAIRPGSIVILHDGGGDRTATINALSTIIKGIRRKGLRLIGIDG